MKFLTVLFLAAALAFLGAENSHAKTWNVDDIVKKADPEEIIDLDKVMDDIELTPTKDIATGKIVTKVTRVNEDSIFQKAGVKVGDLIVSNNPVPTPPQKDSKIPAKVIIPEKKK